jgi:hypothetical protein
MRDQPLALVSLFLALLDNPVKARAFTTKPPKHEVFRFSGVERGGCNLIPLSPLSFNYFSQRTLRSPR